MNSHISTSKRKDRGSVLIEGALFLAVLAILVSGAIALLIHLRFEILTYEAFRKSATELTAWRPSPQYSTGEAAVAAQCRELKDILSLHLKQAGLEVEDFSIQVRPRNSELNIARSQQEVNVRSSGTNSVLDRFLRNRVISFSYIPAPSTSIANCEGQERGGFGGNGE